MKRQFIAFAVVLFAAQTAFAAPIRAPMKDWNPTCAQMLALGYERYADEYENRTGNYSTAGNLQKSERYVECRNAANLRALRVLAPLRRARVLKAQEHLMAWENALWSIEMMGNGNGTMYFSFAAYSSGTRSDALGNLFVATQHAKRAPTARKQANAQWDAANKSLKLWQTSARETFADIEMKNVRAEYNVIYPLTQRELSEMQTIAAQLPDEAALILAKRCAETMANVEKVGF